MEVTKQVFDNLQFNLHGALDDIIRLKARVAALERGEVLPPDQSITVTPQPQPAPVACEEVIAAPAAQPEIIALPDISVGWVGGGRRS